MVAGGSETGHLAIWNFSTGEVRALHPRAHVGKVDALRFASFFGRKVLVSGGIDGMLRFWTLDLTELLRLDFGEGVNAIAPLGDDRFAVGGFGGLVVFRFPKKRPTLGPAGLPFQLELEDTKYAESNIGQRFRTPCNARPTVP